MTSRDEWIREAAEYIRVNAEIDDDYEFVARRIYDELVAPRLRSEAEDVEVQWADVFVDVGGLTEACRRRFRSFGGGHVTPGNPVSFALVDSPSQFAAGVDIRDVVTFIVEAIASTRRTVPATQIGEKE